MKTKLLKIKESRWTSRLLSPIMLVVLMVFFQHCHRWPLL